MLTKTQIRDAKGVIHDLDELVKTRCTITMLSTIPTPQPGVYTNICRNFYSTAEKQWESDADSPYDMTYSSERLAFILNTREHSVVVNRH